MTPRDWSDVPPRLVRLDELVTTKRTLDLGRAARPRTPPSTATCSPTSCSGEGDLYLEDGLHRALRAALHQRPALHARVLVLS